MNLTQNADRLTALYTYSIVRVFYDRGRDFIDSFWPFVLKVLPADLSSIDNKTLKQKIIDEFGLDIPLHSLSVILTRAKRKGFLSTQKNRAALTEKGLAERARLEPQLSVDVRVQELLNDFRDYLKTQGTEMCAEESSMLLNTLIQQNAAVFKHFAEGTDTSAPQKTQHSKSDVLLAAYLAHLKNSNRGLYKTVQDIFFGGIISNTVHKPNFPEEKGFSKTEVFLDSNFIFSLLGLHHDEFVIAAKELFNLIRKYSGFDLLVFDFTVDEIISVLRNYHKEYGHYFTPIRVRSIYSGLKNKGWTPADVVTFTANVVKVLSGYGITIRKTKTTLHSFTPDPARDASLQRYKDDSGERSRKHDLAAIEHVANRRKDSPRLIEEARAIFLTSDKRLCRFNYEEDGHKDRGTISEVILDRVLANVLWMKNPTVVRDIPLNVLIALHSESLFVDRYVWQHFYETAERLRSKGDINDTDISLLVYDSRTQQELGRFEEPSELSGEWILQAVQKLRLEREAAMNEEREKHRRELAMIKSESEISRLEELRNHERVLQSQEETGKEKLRESLSQRRAQIQVDAADWAKNLTNVATGLLVLATFLACFVIAPLIRQYYSEIEPYELVIQIFLAAITLIGIRVNAFSIRSHINEFLFRKIHNIKLSASGLEQLEYELGIAHLERKELFEDFRE